MSSGGPTTGDLEAKIRHAPRSPGVYLMKDGAGEILYVGKARDLKARIRAYFSHTDQRAMVPFLVSRIRDLEFILTGTEKEALILENNLIKEHRPRYNVDFRDDKSYFFIRIDPSEPFPRFQLVRRPKKDGARHFGPYPSSAAAKETLRFLQTILPLRSCRDREMQSRRRPCLEHEIGRCSAPCVGLIAADDYRRLVRDAIAFLEGREKALIGELRERMGRAAEELRFEEAAALRDRVAALEQTLERQRVVSASGRNRDVFGLGRDGGITQVSLLYVRGGRIVGQKGFPPIRLRGESGELLSGLLLRYYDGAADIPDEVVVPVALEDGAVLAEWLGERRGRGVAVVTPKRGEAQALLAIAGRNAESALATARQADDRPGEALRLLAEKLPLGRLPRRIECFDISNIGGRHAVGSLVSFVDGVAAKEGYRRFRIRTVEGADDYAMMYEVLKRRFQRPERLPDLIVVDGGRGQLGVALAVLKDLRLDGIDAIALAKERDDPPPRPGVSEDLPPPWDGRPAGTGGDEPAGEAGRAAADRDGPAGDREGRAATPGRGEDRVFLPGRRDPLYLTRWPPALFLLQRIRDEAHRFALSYHRKLRQKADLQSLIDRIPGVGPSRRRALLTHFGDARRIRDASVAQLAAVDGIGAALARRIREFLDAECMPGRRPDGGDSKPG